MGKQSPSNSELADKVSEIAAELYRMHRGSTLTVAHQVDIGNAVYRSFNSATVDAQISKDLDARDGFNRDAPL